MKIQSREIDITEHIYKQVAFPKFYHFRFVPCTHKKGCDSWTFQPPITTISGQFGHTMCAMQLKAWTRKELHYWYCKECNKAIKRKKWLHFYLRSMYICSKMGTNARKQTYGMTPGCFWRSSVLGKCHVHFYTTVILCALQTVTRLHKPGFVRAMSRKWQTCLWIGWKWHHLSRI